MVDRRDSGTPTLIPNMYLIICPFRHETIDYRVEFQTMFELVLFMIEETRTGEAHSGEWWSLNKARYEK
jgi:hypothetical protein